MTLSEVYKRAVRHAIENDPRGEAAIALYLEDRKRQFDELKEKDKGFFDKESLSNPYADTRILNGTGDEEVTSALVGIDIETPEILLADNLNTKGKRIDAIIAHHPEGMPYANLHDVMSMQADILRTFGVPINVAESLMEGRISEVKRKLMPVNTARAVDAARLLGFPFMCIHTPADNMVAAYLQRLFDNNKPYALSNVIDMLMEIEEYKDAARCFCAPNILLGGPQRKAGKIFVDMTGGTEGSKDLFQVFSSSGINTIVGMHLSEEHKKEAEKYHINVVIAGHISSDNLGMNLLFDKIFAETTVELTGCSGFRRIARHNAV
ncbi:NGG1p interacting factor NIF3 [Candidatus Magnetominusculus xianensis]|uniref:NGG1p interacting factor 3 protein, NIF3 n=1 Tax=Candidatus Magnetominusculus xianensis TaxID=1748249 RepID=A0ABR5SFV7_9BACT|nr:NGG1p interacting factor NIF3 [Candidatus Magnetominusculus xianensis]KWT86944.1 NGG1p interacting factor 3 protein, NIF3 [Candidatus Magnetominusculus xianensis]MBF0403932.1 NGG1p interacting factor NIF3 [Nitrospirota bacterium]